MAKNSGTVLQAGERLAHRRLEALVTEARAALAAVVRGDVDEVFHAHRAMGAAVKVVLTNGMSTTRGTSSICTVCGAEISAGRCWGCGSTPPGRAS